MTENEMHKEIERMAARLCQDIKKKNRRNEVTKEYVNHLEDAVYHYMIRGMTDEEALRTACDELGDVSRTQAMLAVVHNRDEFPSWFKWVLGGFCIVALITAYAVVKHEIVKSWLKLIFQIGFGAFGLWLIWELFIWVQAVRKRLRACRKLAKYAKDNGLDLTQQIHPLITLFRPSRTPEFILDDDKRRYIISLFPTVHRKQVLHLHENGLYTYTKSFGFLLRVGAPAPNTRMTMFIPTEGLGGMANMTYMQQIDLPRGLYRLPSVTYEDYYRASVESIPILLLNPVPMDVDLCANGRVRKLMDGDTLPPSIRVYSLSGFLALLEEIRIFGKEGGRK